jgi:cytochrome c oxidase subunit II
MVVNRTLAIISLLLIFLLSGCAAAPSVLNPQGPDARQIATLTWVMFAIAVIVFIAVVAYLLAGLMRSRRADQEKDALAGGAERSSDHPYLILILAAGALAPAVVLLIIMIFSISIENAAARQAEKYTVEVVGHRWWWEVNYPDQGFTTANEIHIPAGQPVTFKVTSADVIHSFWIPELNGKIDMIPGQTNTIVMQADRPGVYRGQCGEYCGTQHAKMALLVIADAPEDFNAWVKNQQSVPPPPAEGSIEKEGQQAFLGSSCVYCHTIQGTNGSGKIGPDLTHLASRQTIGAGILPNNPGNLTGWILDAQALKPGNLMPPMNLDPEQIQSILAYLQTLK